MNDMKPTLMEAAAQSDKMLNDRFAALEARVEGLEKLEQKRHPNLYPPPAPAQGSGTRWICTKCTACSCEEGAADWIEVVPAADLDAANRLIEHHRAERESRNALLRNADKEIAALREKLKEAEGRNVALNVSYTNAAEAYNRALASANGLREKLEEAESLNQNDYKMLWEKAEATIERVRTVLANFEETLGTFARQAFRAALAAGEGK